MDLEESSGSTSERLEAQIDTQLDTIRSTISEGLSYLDHRALGEVIDKLQFLKLSIDLQIRRKRGHV